MRTNRIEGLGWVFGSHDQSFVRFGGRAEMRLHDNPPTPVTAEKPASGHTRWEPKVRARIAFYDVEIRLSK